MSQVSHGRQATAALPPRPGAPGCRLCGVPLTPHQAVRGICPAPACETRRVQEAARRVFQRNWEGYVERQRLGVEAAAAQVASAIRQLGEEPEKVAIGVVPFQDRPLTELPQARRAAFALHLDSIVAEAFASSAPPEPDLLRRESAEQEESAVAGAACATCRGKCCFLGGTKAFLDAETIQLYRWRDPGATAEDVRSHYLSRLPERSAEHSCVYHGERGCNLSRYERADICNRYHCNPQMDLLRRFRAMGASSAVIVAHDDEVGPVVGVLDAGGWRRHEAADEDVSPELLSRAVAAGIAQLPPDMPGGAPPNRPAEPVCAWCGALIDRHRAVTRQSCGNPECERRRIAELSAEFERGKAVRHAALVRRMRDAHVTEIGRVADLRGLTPEAVALGVVPVLEAAAETVQAERRAAFAAHLDEIIAQGFLAPVGAEGGEPPENADLASPEPPLAVSACTLCAGGCCRGGGERAYLSSDHVLRMRRTDPALSPERVRAFYLDRLPEAAVRGSCIYHGPRGCSLPRDARSDICNGFRCRGLTTLLDEAGGTGHDAAAIVAVDDEDRPRRVGRFGAEAGAGRETA